MRELYNITNNLNYQKTGFLELIKDNFINLVIIVFNHSLPCRRPINLVKLRLWKFGKLRIVWY